MNVRLEDFFKFIGPEPCDSDHRRSSQCLARALASQVCDSDTGRIPHAHRRAVGRFVSTCEWTRWRSDISERTCADLDSEHMLTSTSGIWSRVQVTDCSVVRMTSNRHSNDGRFLNLKIHFVFESLSGTSRMDAARSPKPSMQREEAVPQAVPKPGAESSAPPCCDSCAPRSLLGNGSWPRRTHCRVAAGAAPAAPNLCAGPRPGAEKGAPVCSDRSAVL
jgi:hypothetical protein